MKKLLFSIICHFLISVLGFSQNDQLTNDIASERSPFPGAEIGGAGSSNAFVDLATGRAKYSIPLFKHSAGMANLNISISYLSGGVKLGNFAGWVGTDWTLSGYGFIERELVGLEDEKPEKGYIDYASSDFENFENLDASNQRKFIGEAQKRENDTEADKFHFSFGGYGGYFFFDNQGEIHTAPEQDFMFKDVSIDEKNRINGFTIIDKKGVRYIFGYNSDAVETTSVATFTTYAVININYKNTSWSYKDPKLSFDLKRKKDPEEEVLNEVPYTSKWYLTDIEFPDNSYIAYQYEDVGTNFYTTSEKLVKTTILNTIIRDEVGLNPKYVPAKKVKFTKEEEEKCRNGRYLTKEEMLDCRRGYRREPTGGTLNELSDYNVQISGISTTKKCLSLVKMSDGTVVDFNVSRERSDANKLAKITGLIVYNTLGNIVKNIGFEFNTVTSSTYTEESNDPDPFNTVEALVYRNRNFQYEGPLDYIPAHLCLNHEKHLESLPRSDLYKKYLLEGLKPYNYKRLFLKNISIRGTGSQLLEYSLQYYLPEKLHRRTSSAVTLFGLQDNSTLGEDGKISISNDQKFLLAKISGSVISNLGMLKSIDLPSAGRIEFKYMPSKATMCVEKIALYEMEGAPIYVDKFKYYSSQIACTRTTFPYYVSYNGNTYEGVKRKGSEHSHQLYNVASNYNFCSGGYTNNSPIGFEKVDVARNTSNSKTEYVFTTVKDDLYSLYYSPKLTGEEEDVEAPVACGSWDNPRRIRLDWKFNMKKGASEISPPKNSNSEKRGLLKQINYYNGDEVIRQVDYEYNFEEEGFESNMAAKSIRGSKRRYNRYTKVKYGFPNCSLEQKNWDDIMYAGIYYYYSDRVFKTKKTASEKRGGNWITNSENYLYEYGLLTEIVTANSNQQDLKTIYRYSSDYHDQPFYCSNPDENMLDAIEKMHSKNMLNTPVEVVSCKDGKVIGGKLNMFSYDWDNKLVLPASTLALETKAYIDDFKPSRVSTSMQCSKDFISDDRYKTKVVYDKFDEKGNLLQYHPENGSPKSIIYGYNKTLPIAEAINAEHNQIYFTSFEDQSDAFPHRNASHKHTGDYSYILDDSYGWVDLCVLEIPREELSDKYTFSVWYRTEDMVDGEDVANFGYYIRDENDTELVPLGYFLYETGGEWKYKSFTIDMEKIKADYPNVKTFKLDMFAFRRDEHVVYIDDFRIHPNEARMTTYTHTPLVGVTSVTDANNRTTRYEYDGLGRLLRTYDHKGNLVEENKYNYKKPYLVAEKTDLKFGNAGGTIRMKVFKNKVSSMKQVTNYSEIGGSGWLIVAVHDMGGYYDVSIQCSSYADVQNRWATIKITATGNDGKTYTEEIAVNQYNYILRQ